MKVSAQKFIFILSTVASITSFEVVAQTPPPVSPTISASTSTPGPALPEKARVVAQSVDVLREPKPEADRVLLLVRGHPVDVLEKMPPYAKIKFLIDGEFSVEGYIPLGALSIGAQSIEPFVPQYLPDAKAPSQDAETFPGFQGKNFTPELESNQTPKDSDLSRRSLPAAKASPSPRATGPLTFHLSVASGYSTESESVKTKNANTGAAATESFLSYDLSGLSLATHFEGRYAYDRDWTLGGRILYRLSLFRANVGADNTNIRSSRVQAQRHRMELEPFVSWKREVRSGYWVEPELAPSLGYEAFLSNQLLDRDPSNLGRDGQPVIFNDYGLTSRVSFRPRVYFPFDLTLTPEVGLWLFYMFSEHPQTTTDASGEAVAESRMIRTGKTDSISPISLFYGVRLDWSMSRLGLPRTKVFVHFKQESVEKKYSGRGNRAGVATLDATSITSLMNAGAGLTIDF